MGVGGLRLWRPRLRRAPPAQGQSRRIFPVSSKASRASAERPPLWPPFYFCRLRFVTPSRLWRFQSVCRCADFRMPSKNATGVTISWPSERAEDISNWANTGDPTAFRRCSPISTRRMPISLVRGASGRSWIYEGLFGGYSAPQHQRVGPRCCNLDGERPRSDAPNHNRLSWLLSPGPRAHLGRNTRIQLSFFAYNRRGGEFGGRARFESP